MSVYAVQQQPTKKILIADDDAGVIHTIFSLFEENHPNYELFQAPNGAIACQLATKECPDLVIMDWAMPVMNGIEAIAYLKKNELTRDIPVIMATGVKVQDEYLREALKTGAIDYIRKPINKVELMARSQAAIRLADLHKREKRLMQSVIEHKNRELSTLVIQVSQKNQILDDIYQKLLALNVKGQGMRTILKSVQNSMDWDNYWEKFKLHFEEVHPNFFANLQGHYQALSQNEQKLCAYIKMQLSNKEIAQILNISTRGLETARYRIKKKLNLTNQQDLNKFIQQF